MQKNKRPNVLANLRFEPWADQEWVESLKNIGNSAIPAKSFFLMEQLLKNCVQLDGDMAEFGVWKGASARFISERIAESGKTLHLFDTFSGMPEVSQKDNFWQKGDWHNTSLVEVKERLKGMKVEFHVGDICKTLGNFDAKLCFAHVDCDLYMPIMESSRYIYENISGGGVIVYDDYGYKDCAGAKLAVDEFYKDKSESPIYIPGLQCIVIKRS